MAKKDIQVFGLSFLDLLSGALAAVIILFVVVPKMSSDEQAILDEMEQLEMDVESFRAVMEELKSSIDADVYAQVMQTIDDMENHLNQLSEQVASQQELIAELEKYRDWMAQCNFTPEMECPVGIDPLSFVQVQIEWDEGVELEEGQQYGIDIDLFVEDPDGNVFSYRNVRYPGVHGRMTQDGKNGPGMEVWSADEAKAGIYNIYYNYYLHPTNPNKVPVDVRGRIIYNGGKQTIPLQIMNEPQEGDDFRILIYSMEFDHNGNAQFTSHQ